MDKGLVFLISISIWTLIMGTILILGIRSNIREQNDPFLYRNQVVTFNKVASLMHYEINPILLPPRILKGSEVTTEYNNSVWGFDVGDKRSNIFDYKNNVIILCDDAKIHSLAHEYVHYFQYQYGLQDFDEGLTDRQEMEAVQIQHQFK